MRRKLKLSVANPLIISFSHLPAHEKDSASIEGWSCLDRDRLLVSFFIFSSPITYHPSKMKESVPVPRYLEGRISYQKSCVTSVSHFCVC